MQSVLDKVQFDGWVEYMLTMTDGQILAMVDREDVKHVYVLTKSSDNTWSKELLEMDEEISCLRRLTDSSFVVGSPYNTITVWRKDDMVWKKDNTLDCSRTRIGQIVIDNSIMDLAPLPDGRIVSITHSDILVWDNNGDGWFPDRLLGIYAEHEYDEYEVPRRQILHLLVEDGTIVTECDDSVTNTYKNIDGDWKLIR